MRAATRPPRRLFLLLASLLGTAWLAGCASPAVEREELPPARAPDGVTEEFDRLEPNTFRLPTFGAEGPYFVRATVEVLSGAVMDVWLGSEEECALYGRPEFAPRAEALAVEEATLEAAFEGGLGCLVLDNADFAGGEATAEGSVALRYKLEVWTL